MGYCRTKWFDQDLLQALACLEHSMQEPIFMSTRQVQQAVLHCYAATAQEIGMVMHTCDNGCGLVPLACLAGRVWAQCQQTTPPQDVEHNQSNTAQNRDGQGQGYNVESGHAPEPWPRSLQNRSP